ncbi:TMEM175 family protein [Sporolactobacillus pectinivorans]|uniref:TMEM175 family protein n=1 Tax=Sporolactobacillus pectinivorans TaxID=1591408 RepID=UPI000C26B556|nr:TMEM175 family protein [Sporolactobacillus pectinivorans]
MGKNRIEAFSDGVFAIAITLLVLNINNPDLIKASITSTLIRLYPNILAYILSFMTIGVYWVAHHTMIHFVRTIDRTALWINNLTLLFIAFMPFPTLLISWHYNDPIATTIYCLTLSMTNLTGSWFWWYVSKNSRHIEEGLSGKFIHRILVVHLCPIAIYVLAICFSFYSIYISYFLIALVPAFFILSNPLINKILLIDKTDRPWK